MSTHRLPCVLRLIFVIESFVQQNAVWQTPNDARVQDRLSALESNPDDHPVFLLRLFKFKGDSDRATFRRYLQVSLGRIRELGGEVIFYGKANPFEIDFTGSEKVIGFRPCPWDRIVLERYGSRIDIRKLGESTAYAQAMVDLESSLAETVVYALNGSPWSGGTQRSKADAVTGPPKPPTPNQAVYMLNLLAFKPGGQKIYLQQYARAVMPLITQTHRGEVIYGLKTEQLLIGPEEYDRVILVMYPSADAFTDMLLSDAYQEVSHYRTSAISIGHLYAFSNEAAELQSMMDSK